MSDNLFRPVDICNHDVPDVESLVDPDDIDNETQYVIAEDLASFHDDIMKEFDRQRHNSRIDRSIAIVGAVGALVAAVAALYPLIR